MATKVTYLLGAGASAGKSKYATYGESRDNKESRSFVVPPISFLAKQMEELADVIEYIVLNNGEHLNGVRGKEKYYNEEIKREITGNGNFPDNKNEFEQLIQNLINKFNEYAQKHREFGTIDTYVKFLFNTGKTDELINLKFFFSLYLFLEQVLVIENSFQQNVAYNIDQRYITFFTSLSNRDGFPSEDIKILTWNYDYQIELGYFHSYLKEKIENKEKVKVPNLNEDFIYHLNGYAGILDEINGTLQNIFDYYFQRLNDAKFNDNSISPLFQLLYDYLRQNIDSENKFINRSEISLKFAFEGNNELFGEVEPTNKDSFVNHLQETEVLVIIGYTFPFFNREMDKKIIEILLNPISELKRIYIQTKKEEGRDEDFYRNIFVSQNRDMINAKSKFLGGNINIKDFIQVVFEVQNFFIPPEL